MLLLRILLVFTFLYLPSPAPNSQGSDLRSEGSGNERGKWHVKEKKIKNVDMPIISLSLSFTFHSSLYPSK